VAAIPTPPAPKAKGKKPTKKPTQTAAQIGSPTTNTQPNTQAEATAQPVPAVPKLGEILSEDQKAQHLKACDESLARAHEAVTQLKSATLSADQKASLSRVRTFIYQAEKAREKDPQTARQLAERADLLSRDLVRTVR